MYVVVSQVASHLLRGLVTAPREQLDVIDGDVAVVVGAPSGLDVDGGHLAGAERHFRFNPPLPLVTGPCEGDAVPDNNVQAVDVETEHEVVEAEAGGAGRERANLQTGPLYVGRRPIAALEVQITT